MLIRVVITNFRSYGKETEFNMLPSSNVRRKGWHVYNSGGGVNILRTAVIYGANGAGKSSLVKALSRVKTMVANGCLPPTTFRDSNKFIDQSIPVTIEVEFRTKENQYSYGLSFRNNLCVEEWLYSTIKKPVCVFERKYDSELGKSNISLSGTQKDEAKNKLLVSLLEDNLLKNNELLLSKHDVVKNILMTDAYNWFTTKLHVILPDSRSTSIFDSRYSDNQFKLHAETFISSLDLGISKLTLKDEDIEAFKQSIPDWPELSQGIDSIVKSLSYSPEGSREAMIDTGIFTVGVRRDGNKYFVRRVQAIHKVNDHPYDFELKEESDGTQRIFDFLPMVNSVKKEPCTYVIDELDRSLHP